MSYVSSKASTRGALSAAAHRVTTPRCGGRDRKAGDARIPCVRTLAIPARTPAIVAILDEECLFLRQPYDAPVHGGTPHDQQTGSWSVVHTRRCTGLSKPCPIRRADTLERNSLPALIWRHCTATRATAWWTRSTC